MIIFFCLLTLFIGKNSYSAEDCDSTSARPDVLVTIIFIKETKVCTLDGKPSSYCNKKNKKEERCCDKLHYTQLKYLKEDGDTVTDEKPIDTINLDYLFNRVKLYSLRCRLDKPCTNPEDRFSILLAFEFQMKKPKGMIVTLERKIPKNMEIFFEEPDYGNYYVKGELEEGGHWIRHERADLFLPGHEVEWLLKIHEPDKQGGYKELPKYCWKLITDK
jgi:hypothetical protein